jgi:hypothetical protein
MTEYMDMSDPSVQQMLDDAVRLVQQMLDDDRAEALARIRAAKEEEDNEKGE